MIFVSDVHYQLDHLNSLPQNKGPVVILGDLVNWIDYRDGQGIAMDVFGYDNVIKLINLRKQHKFDERKKLWRELYKTDPDKIAKKIQSAINKQYKDVFHVLKKYEVWFIPGNVDDVDIMNTYSSSSIKNVDGLIIEYDNKKIGFAGGGVTNKIEQGWASLKDYIENYQPEFSLFGDVHQPQASYWKIRSTRCINVGYFRATNQYLELSSIYI